jgi:hypothetical protein
MDAGKKIQKSEHYFATLANEEAEYHYRLAKYYLAIADKARQRGDVKQYNDAKEMYNYHMSEYNISIKFVNLRNNYADHPEQFQNGFNSILWM